MSAFPDFLTDTRRRVLLRFQKQAGICFKNLCLLDMALQHSSFSHEHRNLSGNNERLEFLGDSVLGMVLTEFLYIHFPHAPEGHLAKIKAIVAAEDSLAEIGFKLGIDSVLLLGRGEDSSGGRKKKALIADALEALIGALYLDSGLSAVTQFIRAHFERVIRLTAENKYHRDYKSLLQERIQKSKKVLPCYQVVDQTGPDHRKVFWVELLIDGTVCGKAHGHNKKEAEQAAAKIVWDCLENNTPSV